jgi:GAF domain-containing protein
MGSLEPSERQDFVNFPERVAAMHVAAGEGAGYSADRLHHLTDLIAMVSAQTDLAAVMEQALAALVDIAGAERGFLLLYKGFEVTQQIFHGMREDESDAYSSGLAYQILWGGEPVFIEDAQSHQEFADRESIQSLALRSMVGVPLHDGTETIGVMLADSQRINTRFSPEDLDLCMALGRQVAITIGNARRLEQYRNGYEELAMLHRLALATLGLTDLEAFLKPVAAEAVRLCDADRVLLLVGEGLACSAGIDRQGRVLPEAPTDISSGVGQWVLEHGEPLHLLDAQSEEAFQSRKSIQTLGLRTIYAVPVTHEGKRLGVLYMDHTRMGDPNPHGLHALARIGEMVGAFLSR